MRLTLLRVFTVLGAASLAALLTGCEPKPKVQQDLKSQSPFQSDPARADEVLILSCTVYHFELPRQTKLDELACWQKYADWGVAQDAIQTRLDPNALKQWQAQLACWKSNGLLMAVAPQSAWAEFRQALVDAGAVMQSSRQGLFRRPADIMECPLYPFTESRSLFVRDREEHLRGYRLEPGEWFFQFNLILEHQRTDNLLFFQMAPGYRGAQAVQTFETDPQTGSLRQVEKRTEILLDAVTVRAMLQKDWFIVIAGQAAQKQLDCLGSVILAPSGREQNVQCVLVLAPQLLTGAELKKSLKKSY